MTKRRSAHVVKVNRTCKGFHVSDSSAWSNESMFAEVVTIDPSRVEEAWDTLSSDTRAIEYQELPKRMHHSLIQALKSSQKLERFFG